MRSVYKYYFNDTEKEIICEALSTLMDKAQDEGQWQLTTDAIDRVYEYIFHQKAIGEDE